MSINIKKDSNDIIRRGFDWTLLFSAIGGSLSILTSIWSVSPEGLDLDDDGISYPYTKVFLSGGTPDIVYTISNKITVSNGETYERSFAVTVQTNVMV